MNDRSPASTATRRRYVQPTPEEALAGLSCSVLRRVRRAEQWLVRGEPKHAERALAEALQMEPEHPELLRMRALVLHEQKRYAESIQLLRAAIARQPDDPRLHNNLGSALGQSGDFVAALEAFRRTTELSPEDPVVWFNLGKACDALHMTEDAQNAFARAMVGKPDYVEAIVMHAATNRTMGHIDAAIAGYRRALDLQPESVEAWTELIGLKAEQPSAGDLPAIEALSRRPGMPDDQQASLGFVLGLALEASDRHAEAFAAFVSANAARRKTLKWNAGVFSGIIATLPDAFAAEVAGTPDADFGREAIFLFGMPRSGSTLAEQIISTHTEVEGAGEIGDLPVVLDAESRRRNSPFPKWVADATAADWQRLGEEYLLRASRKRPGKTRMFTDKSLSNWQLAGAVRAMLPGAHLIDCRRDALESCWSCFKHQFGQNQPFSCDFSELAAWWRDYDRLVAFWIERYPGLMYQHHYESLVADPEKHIRKLLAHCGLEFEPGCLRFHETRRDVRTSSAAQVRVPLRSDTARAARYGGLLDPLRDALAGRSPS